jgi:hypothetical protein
MSVHITRGNKKLGKHVANISLPPVVTCPRGVPCTNSNCYAHKAWRQYPNVRQAWGENLAEYVMNPKGYFASIQRWLWRHKPSRFRWHVAGDIPNQEYLDGMIMIAKLNRLTRFLCFTKRYELEYKGIPSNLSIFISAWPGYGIVNVHSSAEQVQVPGVQQVYHPLPIAWCQDGTETRIPLGAYECPGSCEQCDHCWERRTDVWFHKH